MSGSCRSPKSPNIIWPSLSPSLSPFITGANDLRCWRTLKPQIYTYIRPKSCMQEEPLLHTTLLPCTRPSINDLFLRTWKWLYMNRNSLPVLAEVETLHFIKIHMIHIWILYVGTKFILNYIYIYIYICCSSYFLIGDHCSYFQTTGFSSLRPFSSLMAVTCNMKNFYLKLYK